MYLVNCKDLFLIEIVLLVVDYDNKLSKKKIFMYNKKKKD